jgi:hypothetical protein
VHLMLPLRAATCNGVLPEETSIQFAMPPLTRFRVLLLIDNPSTTVGSSPFIGDWTEPRVVGVASSVIPRQNLSVSTSSFATARCTKNGYSAASVDEVSDAVFCHELVVSLADFDKETVDPSAVMEGTILDRGE